MKTQQEHFKKFFNKAQANANKVEIESNLELLKLMQVKEFDCIKKVKLHLDKMVLKYKDTSFVNNSKYQEFVPAFNTRPHRQEDGEWKDTYRTLGFFRNPTMIESITVHNQDKKVPYDLVAVGFTDEDGYEEVSVFAEHYALLKCINTRAIQKAENTIDQEMS